MEPGTSEQERSQARLDDYRFQMGYDAGNLAMVLDRLTDVMTAVALHTVHCRVERGPRKGEPPLDINHLLGVIREAKGLVLPTGVSLGRGAIGIGVMSRDEVTGASSGSAGSGADFRNRSEAK